MNYIEINLINIFLDDIKKYPIEEQNLLLIRKLEEVVSDSQELLNQIQFLHSQISKYQNILDSYQMQ